MLSSLALEERRTDGTRIIVTTYTGDRNASVPALLQPGAGSESRDGSGAGQEIFDPELPDPDRGGSVKEVRVREVPADQEQGPVEERGLADGSSNAVSADDSARAGVSTPVGEKAPSRTPTGGEQAVSKAEADGSAEQAFYEGYALGGGPQEYAAHAYRIITTCEGRSGWTGYYGPHWTRAQFSGDTWTSVKRFIEAAGYTVDPDSPFIVGMGVSYWIRAIGVAAAGTTSGWPTCWWR